jgi:ribosomal protein L7Ae-like RNA K-turn-binding protein
MEHNIDKTLGLLSIARTAGKLQLGEEAVGTLLFEKRARLTVLAADAVSSRLRKRALAK